MIELSSGQQVHQQYYRKFVNDCVAPFANKYDEAQCLGDDLLKQFKTPKLLGALITQEFGGAGVDQIDFGLLCEEIGRGCSSLRTLLTVHSMVSYAIMRWGTQTQKQQWLPRLANGNEIGVFGLSEPSAGSNIHEITTTAVKQGHRFVLNGTKQWISFAQLGTLILVFAKCENLPCAFIVEHDRPGVTIQPINNLLGTRAAMTGTISLRNCVIPDCNLIGAINFGFSHVLTSALNLGRYSIAWGSTGISQACLAACINYSIKRHQFGKPIKEHQLVRRLITEIITTTAASRSLCYNAGKLSLNSDPQAIEAILIAKYFASKHASKNANYAVQIHGANGCSNDYSVARFMRDAKIMEIIEGSTEILQNLIPTHYYTQAQPAKKEIAA